MSQHVYTKYNMYFEVSHTSPSTTPSDRTTAAAVSSQLVSMPSTVKGFNMSGSPDRAGAPEPGGPCGGWRASSPTASVDDPVRRTLFALSAQNQPARGYIYIYSIFICTHSSFKCGGTAEHAVVWYQLCYNVYAVHVSNEQSTTKRSGRTGTQAFRKQVLTQTNANTQTIEGTGCFCGVEWGGVPLVSRITGNVDTYVYCERHLFHCLLSPRLSKLAPTTKKKQGTVSYRTQNDHREKSSAAPVSTKLVVRTPNQSTFVA